ncbi:MAG: hypothetical protein QF809_04605, partial [Candidatus Peribacteraceae bacterium]|nr:hypothetical protein [Candidatus Peribacteraceae bacterium]
YIGSSELDNVYMQDTTGTAVSITSGNVGIGTAAPTEKLHVAGHIMSSTTGYTSDPVGAVFGLYTSGAVPTSYLQAPAVGDVQIWNAGTSAIATFTAARNVGIGTIVPSTQLEVQAAAGSAGVATLSTGELTVVDGDVLGQINFQAPLESDGTDAILVGASIWAEADATFDASTNSTELVFATASSDTAAEAMRIDSAGNLGIGTMSPTANLMIAQSANGTGALIDSEATTAPALAIDAVATPAQVANAPHILFGYRGMFDVKMYRSGTGALRVASESGTTLAVDTESSTATDIVFKVISDNGSNENTVLKVQADGKTFADGAYSSGGADYAEWFPTQEENLGTGEPVCIDTEHDGNIKRCNGNLSDIFVGITSTNPAFIGGYSDTEYEGNLVLVGLIGQVMVNITDESGLIKRGDVLTPSYTPGVARKATPWDKNHKGIALIAIQNQKEPRDKIKVLLK